MMRKQKKKISVTRFEAVWADEDDGGEYAEYVDKMAPKWARYVSAEESIWTSAQIIEPTQDIPPVELKYKCTRMVSDIKSYPRAIQYHPSGEFFLVLTKGVYLLKKEKDIYSTLDEIFDKRLFDAKFSSNRADIILLTDRSFKSYNIEKKILTSVADQDQTGKLSKLAISNSETGIFASIKDGNRVVLFSQKDKQSISQFTSNVTLNDLTFSHDSNYLYAAGKGEMYVWDIRSTSIYSRYYDYGNIYTSCIANSPNGKYQATGSDMGVVNLYSIEDNFRQIEKPQPIKDFYNLNTIITSMAFSHDSQLLCYASSEKDKAIKMVNLKTRTVYKNFPPQINLKVTCLAFSPLSDSLLFGSAAGTFHCSLDHYQK